MTLPKSSIDGQVQLFERGLATDREVVETLLLRSAALADLEFDPDLPGLLTQLPKSLSNSMCSYLNELRESGFQWRPRLIGTALSEDLLNRLNRRLRLMHEQVSIADWQNGIDQE